MLTRSANIAQNALRSYQNALRLTHNTLRVTHNTLRSMDPKMAHGGAKKMTYKWTDEDVDKLIRLRMEKESLFSGKRFASAAGWEAVIQELGLTEFISPARAAKKWENLKKTYKELLRPPTGSGTEAGEASAASWKWFSLMHEAIGNRASVRPPCLIASCWENPSTSSGASSASVQQQQEQAGEDEEEERRPPPAKRPRRGSLFQILEKAESREEERAAREEERARRDEERARREEERQERLLLILEKIVEKI
ncbi:uncharacterized protein LOC111949280 isoform X1 [Oryzias latipes]|uniref:uncharacterized protein LOC111949280 isoform X1 n=1 Tax=Oryzias latipes TaxID=8090 RepID=UPI000CE1C254|nr:uncharacterized protein LOC111949280 isoform X1 [Oryzias latipes]